MKEKSTNNNNVETQAFSRYTIHAKGDHYSFLFSSGSTQIYHCLFTYNLHLLVEADMLKPFAMEVKSRGQNKKRPTIAKQLNSGFFRLSQILTPYENKKSSFESKGEKPKLTMRIINGMRVLCVNSLAARTLFF